VKRSPLRSQFFTSNFLTSFLSHLPRSIRFSRCIRVADFFPSLSRAFISPEQLPNRRIRVQLWKRFATQPFFARLKISSLPSHFPLFRFRGASHPRSFYTERFVLRSPLCLFLLYLSSPTLQRFYLGSFNVLHFLFQCALHSAPPSPSFSSVARCRRS